MFTLGGTEFDKLWTVSNKEICMPQQLYNKVTSRLYLYFIPGVSANQVCPTRFAVCCASAHTPRCCLSPPVCNQALQMAKFMWEKDCRAGDTRGLCYADFHHLVIEVACSWCQFHTEKEYVQFLKTIQRILVPADLTDQYSALKTRMLSVIREKRTHRKTQAPTNDEVEQEIGELLTKASTFFMEVYSPKHSPSSGPSSPDGQRFQQLLHRNAYPRTRQVAPGFDGVEHVPEPETVPEDADSDREQESLVLASVAQV